MWPANSGLDLAWVICIFPWPIETRHRRDSSWPKSKYFWVDSSI